MLRQRYIKTESKKYHTSLIWDIEVVDSIITTTSFREGQPKITTTVDKSYVNDGSSVSEQNAIANARRQISRRLSLGYVQDMNHVAIVEQPKHWSTKLPPLLIMPMTGKEPWIELGCYQHPKIDGLRCIAYYDHVTEDWNITMSQLQHFGTVSTIDYVTTIKRELSENFNRDCVYDGTLTLKGDAISVINTFGGPQMTIPQEDALVFVIMDVVDLHASQKDRLRTLWLNTPSAHVHIVEHVDVKTWCEIEQVHRSYQLRGYSGSVVRSKYGRFNTDYIDVRMLNITKYAIVSVRFDSIDVSTHCTNSRIIWKCSTVEGLEFECVHRTVQPLDYFKDPTLFVDKKLNVLHQGCIGCVPMLAVGLSVDMM